MWHKYATTLIFHFHIVSVCLSKLLPAVFFTTTIQGPVFSQSGYGFSGTGSSLPGAVLKWSRARRKVLIPFDWTYNSSNWRNHGYCIKDHKRTIAGKCACYCTPFERLAGRPKRGVVVCGGSGCMGFMRDMSWSRASWSSNRKFQLPVITIHLLGWSSALAAQIGVWSSVAPRLKEMTRPIMELQTPSRTRRIRLIFPRHLQRWATMQRCSPPMGRSMAMRWVRITIHTQKHLQMDATKTEPESAGAS